MKIDDDLNVFKLVVRIISYNAIFFLLILPIVHGCFYLGELHSHSVLELINDFMYPYGMIALGFTYTSLLIMLLPLCLKWRIYILGAIEIALVSLNGVETVNIFWMYYPIFISLMATLMACVPFEKHVSSVKNCISEEEKSTRQWIVLIIFISVMIAMGKTL